MVQLTMAASRPSNWMARKIILDVDPGIDDAVALCMALGDPSLEVVAITATGVCSVSSGGSGSATILMTSGTGTCVVNYNQGGNTNYAAAAQVTKSVTAVGYQFTGFFQPIDMPAGTTIVWNTATAGQAIPAKWQLTLNGAQVSALSSYVGMYSVEVACGTAAGALEDAIEEYAPGASTITYDGNGNFHINWKTLTAYKGKCRAFYVSFNDGSTSKVAYFKFK